MSSNSKTRRRQADLRYVPAGLTLVEPGAEPAARPVPASATVLHLPGADTVPEQAQGPQTSHAAVQSPAAAPQSMRDYCARDFSIPDHDDFVSTQPSDLFLDELLESVEAGVVVSSSGLHRGPQRKPRSAAAGQPAEPIEQRLRFTGTGAEYFRLWIVNTLLSVLTLGLYSAWARRRQLRWFARHTFLDNEPFDFHGRPRHLLAVRILVLTQLVGVTLAFQWAAWAGWSVLALWCLFSPAVFADARRFRLTSTSWRGVRFGFPARTAWVHACWMPLSAVCAMGLFCVAAGLAPWALGLIALGLVLGFPLVHGWLLGFQHQHATYGNQPFKSDFPRLGFQPLALKVIGAVALAGLGAGIAALVVLSRHPAAVHLDLPGVVSLVTAGSAALTLALAWPFYTGRLRQQAWGRLQLPGGVGFRRELKVGAAAKAWAIHGLLVVLTLGLYWPFLAVRLARLRAESLTVLTEEPLADVVVPERLSAAELFGMTPRRHA